MFTFLKKNYLLILGVLVLVAFISYYYTGSLIPNEGDVSVDKVNDDLFNDLYNSGKINPGLDEYTHFQGEQTGAPVVEGNPIEYKNKKYILPDEDAKSLYKVKDYLPQEKVPAWFDVPETTVKIPDVNLIDNKEYIGVNTIGSSLRNANRDLRPQPPVPRRNVSIWNMSTIDPDTNLRSLC